MRKMLKWAGTALFFAVVALLLAVTLVPAFLDRRYYDGPESGHYDGERFFNPDGEDTRRPPAKGGRTSFIVAQATGGDGRPDWPEQVAVTPARPPARVEGGRMLATWVGHATMLVQANGLNILTDPIWSERAGPFGFGPRRVTRPGVRLEDLPRIDLILVSHNHYDHMDLATLRRLWERDRPLIVTSLGNDTLIRDAGAEAVALDWGRSLRRGTIDVSVVRNHHWGSRWFVDRNRALWSSFVVRLPGGNLFFAGDTGFGDGEWPREAARLGPVRLALIPIGAFRFEPGQMRTGSHIGPEEAVEVFRRLGAAYGLAVHWGTFRLSFEGRETPPALMNVALRCAGLPETGLFDAIPVGTTVEVPRLNAQPAGVARRPHCTAEQGRAYR